MNDTDSAAPSPIIVVRRARSEDLDAVEALLAEADLPSAGLPELFASNPATFLLAEQQEGEGASVTGVAGLEIAGSNALLRSVAVRPALRSRGVARALVEGVISDANQRGLVALYLLTTTAEDYFPRFGFERIARAAVPAEIAATVEFASACPASAVAMRRVLRAEQV